MHGARRASDRTRERTHHELSRLVDVLRTRVPLRRVLAFGSFARGDMHELSDLDLVVVGEFEQPRQLRGLVVREVAWELGLDVPIEVVAYTPEEFERARHRPFLAHVLSEAIEIPIPPS
jgi:hypothetical protein